MKQKMIISLIFVILLSFGVEIFPIGNIIAENQENKFYMQIKTTRNNNPLINNRGNYTSHEPIKIESNNDFNFTNGVTKGSGTQNDPYIIENLSINGTPNGYCISIENTDKHLIIRNCFLYEAYSEEGDDYLLIDYGNIRLLETTNVICENNYCQRSTNCIRVYRSSNNIIQNNNLNSSTNGIYIKYSNHNKISNNNCSNNIYNGIKLETESSNNIIENNNCSDLKKDGSGIALWNDCNNNIIKGNQCSNIQYLKGGTGVYIQSSSGNIIKFNLCKNTSNGISLSGSSSNHVIKNNCENNSRNGIYIGGSGNILIRNYIAFSKEYGIFIWGGSSNKLYSNNMIRCGIHIKMTYWSGDNTFKSQIIPINNTVNGNPLYYYKNGNQNNVIVPKDAGQVILGEVSNVKISGLNVTGGSIGILIGFSSNIIITNNNCSSNTMYGIHLIQSNSVIIESNKCLLNGKTGIFLWGAGPNIIKNNIISENQRGIDLLYTTSNTVEYNDIYQNYYSGIYFEGSDLNSIAYNYIFKNLFGIFLNGKTIMDLIIRGSFENNITNNSIENNSWYGIEILRLSSNNNIYHNNFINNNHVITDPQNSQASDNGSTNNWDNGSEGNYWSNYKKRYTGAQTKTPTLIIWDTPYDINNGSNKDNYPLIEYVNITSLNSNRSQIIQNINLELKLNKNKYNLGENISGELISSNYNSIDIFSVIPSNHGKNISSSPNILFEINEQNSSQKYYSWHTQIFKIPAKSNQTINFSLSGFNTTKDWIANQSKLPPGNYSIQSTFRIYIESNFYFNMSSNEENFEIFKKIPEQDNNATISFENLSISINLSKQKFQFGNPINGTVIISNNNSFDITINHPQYQNIFGCFFDIRTINNKSHFEAVIDNLVPYRINAKSNLKINFSLNKFVEVPSIGKRVYYSNLTPENYKITAYLFDHDSPDYELEIPDILKILSNQVIFEVFENIPDETANISIYLKLSKSVFNVNESVNGSINISNNNLFSIELKKNILSQRLMGEHFEIYSLDTFINYGALINEIKYPIKVKAQNNSIIEFKIDKIFKLPLKSKNITTTTLAPGNYSIFAYFHYGNLTEFVKLNSNYVLFKISDNKSNPAGQTFPTNPPLGKNQTGSSTTLIFYSSIGILVVITLLTTFFITGTEVGKYGFFSAIAPLYTKRRKRKDEHYGYNKGLIQGYIDGNPGESYNAIKRSLRLKNGTLAYYLKVLQRENIIRSERDGMYKRFYPTKGKITKEVIELSSIQQQIYQFIKENPGCSQMDISKKLKMIHSKVYYNINLLIDARLIKLEREGNKSKCYIIEEM